MPARGLPRRSPRSAGDAREVPEPARQAGQDPPGVADRGAGVPELPTVVEADHPDVHQLLADRLTGGAALEVDVVPDADDGAEDPAEAAGESEDAGDRQDDGGVDEERHEPGA